MNRFDGVKKVKLSVKRTNYSARDKGKKKRTGRVIRTLLGVLLVLLALGLKAVGVDAGELFRQDHSIMYAQD